MFDNLGIDSMYIPDYTTLHTVYLEILAVIKFGDLPQIWQKCIIGGI